ncbi:(2Fe-2S)-binding protein [Agaribacter flavus]|uniref:Bacterioferritin-associated ferredoxin n=1 Tax=Agaribacter flavus TaxID=1902781 RepID=A0ABV7FMV0_9ALTE
MFVCMCYGITDSQIEKAVREDGIGNMRELKAKLGLGSQCGSCVEMAQDIIDTTIVGESLFKNVG